MENAVQLLRIKTNSVRIPKFFVGDVENVRIATDFENPLILKLNYRCPGLCTRWRGGDASLPVERDRKRSFQFDHMLS